MKVAQHFSAGSGVWPFFYRVGAMTEAIFSLSGGFEYQIQGGGPNGEALHCLRVFLTLFAQ
jgi:hypothetical protein